MQNSTHKIFVILLLILFMILISVINVMIQIIIIKDVMHQKDAYTLKMIVATITYNAMNVKRDILEILQAYAYLVHMKYQIVKNVIWK